MSVGELPLLGPRRAALLGPRRAVLHVRRAHRRWLTLTCTHTRTILPAAESLPSGTSAFGQNPVFFNTTHSDLGRSVNCLPYLQWPAGRQQQLWARSAARLWPLGCLLFLTQARCTLLSDPMGPVQTACVLTGVSRVAVPWDCACGQLLQRCTSFIWALGQVLPV